ncbi:MAG TPA: Rieske 2Fe-2S domain-containing protein [Stellaceae bacterium]|jgi:phenylpropionate dioxygenase-like ring-hydroxylating dioxygenase large terminal subunit
MNDDAYHRIWVPVALADEVSAGQPLGVDLLGTRVVAYRDPAGKPVVQTAWCPHLGADLSVGQIAEGQIRCPYHHWRFDAKGGCAHIPTGDKIPPGARIATWPVAETWGLVWAFNGAEPLYPPPGIPAIAEPELAIEARRRGTRNLPPWVPVSNGIDFQHLRALHGLQTTEPDAVEFGEHTIEYRIEAERYTQHGRITGTNVFAQHLRREGLDLYMLFAGAPIDTNTSRGFNVIGIRNSGNPAVVAARLQAVRGFVDCLLAEDDPVLNTMRFKPGTFVAADRYLTRFFKWVREFPTAAVA